MREPDTPLLGTVWGRLVNTLHIFFITTVLRGSGGSPLQYLVRDRLIVIVGLRARDYILGQIDYKKTCFNLNSLLLLIWGQYTPYLTFWLDIL